jgi:cytochrome P450
VQRDDQEIPFADHFVPEVWLDGTAQRPGGIVPFSAGPGECASRDLALMADSVFLAVLLRAREFQPIGGKRLDPARPLPRTLSPFKLKFAARRMNPFHPAVFPAQDGPSSSRARPGRSAHQGERQGRTGESGPCGDFAGQDEKSSMKSVSRPGRPPHSA